MTIQLICLLGGVLLPYVWAGSSVPFRNKQFGRIDLVQPRVQADGLVDNGAWAVGAQMNAWEALNVFAVANFAAFAAGADPAGIWATSCVVWLVSRVAHGIFYIAGNAPLRVLGFFGGAISSLVIFAQAFLA